jgi:hypothetical protein
MVILLWISQGMKARQVLKESIGAWMLTFVQFNPYEASLRELKAFTGLLNACSPPACCSEFYAPDSMSCMLVDKIAFGQEEDDDDDIMKMINDISYTSDLNTPLVTKSIRSISNNDIFTNIVNVCERYGFVRPNVSAELLTKKDSSNVSLMDLGEEAEKVTPAVAIDQVHSKYKS